MNMRLATEKRNFDPDNGIFCINFLFYLQKLSTNDEYIFFYIFNINMMTNVIVYDITHQYVIKHVLFCPHCAILFLPVYLYTIYEKYFFRFS